MWTSRRACHHAKSAISSLHAKHIDPCWPIGSDGCGHCWLPSDDIMWAVILVVCAKVNCMIHFAWLHVCMVDDLNSIVNNQLITGFSCMMCLARHKLPAKATSVACGLPSHWSHTRHHHPAKHNTVVNEEARHDNHAHTRVRSWCSEINMSPNPFHKVVTIHS